MKKITIDRIKWGAIFVLLPLVVVVCTAVGVLWFIGYFVEKLFYLELHNPFRWDR